MTIFNNKILILSSLTQITDKIMDHHIKFLKYHEQDILVPSIMTHGRTFLSISYSNKTLHHPYFYRHSQNKIIIIKHNAEFNMKNITPSKNVNLHPETTDTLEVLHKQTNTLKIRHQM